MRDLAVLFLYLLATVARLAGPGDCQRPGFRARAGLDYRGRRLCQRAERRGRSRSRARIADSGYGRGSVCMIALHQE